MRYVVRGKQQLDETARLVAGLNPEKTWSVTVSQFHGKRTLEQNDRFHAIIAAVAEETGNDPSALKAWAKQEWGPKLEVKVGDRTVMVPKSSADFTVEEMGTVMDRFEAWAASEWGIAA